jgi:hypothetical protein
MLRLKWLLPTCLLCASFAFAQNPPVLFFSDLTWGPTTGWNNGSTQGAAVTVWGKNFGTTRGSNYVTINGAQATSYAEWDAIGPARGLERITFWIPTSAATGAGTISVTVNGVTSNTLPFTVASGTIYYVDVTNGNNSNNGLTTSTAFKDLWKGFNPCGPTDPMHPTGSCNPSQDGQYIVYVRAGTYTAQDNAAGDGALVSLRGPYGGPTKQKALIAYPGETVNLNITSASHGAVYVANYDPYGFVDYVTYAKFSISGGDYPWACFGSYSRFIGNSMQNLTVYDQTGIIQVSDSKHTSIFGNYFNNDGNDSMKHNVYIKTEYTGLNCSTHDCSTQYTDVGWNEFANAPASDLHGGVIFISKSSESQIATAPTDYVYIHGNYFHDGQMDFIYIGDGVAIGSHLYFYHNIFKGNNSTNGGITMNGGATGENWYNNTFYQMGPTNIAMVEEQSGGTGAVWRNNIWNMGIGQDAYRNESPGTANFDYDLFYSGTGVPSGSGITVTHPVTVNPQFVTPGSDYHLQATSLARGAAANLYSTMNSLPFGTNDYDGLALPSSGAWDIGALQYQSGGGGSPPAAPTGVTVVVH